MYVAPLGPLGSLPGLQSAQSRGETDRVRHDTATAERTQQADEYAEQAAGIGRTAEDEQTTERDADGRRLWEFSRRRRSESDESEGQPTTRDATDAGGHLDLEG